MTTVNVPCTWDGSLYTFDEGVTVNKVHNWVGGACTVCGVSCDHTDSTHTAVTDKGDGTHSFECSVCGETGSEAHNYKTGTSAGACACGAACPHSNFDSATGNCKDCEISLAIAKIKTGETTTYYQTAYELSTAIENNSADQAITLLANFEVIRDLCFYAGEAKNTLDLNGHTLTGSSRIDVEYGELTITGTGSINIFVTADNEGAKIVVGSGVTLNNSLRSVYGGVLDLTNATIPEAGLNVILYSDDSDPTTYNVSDVLLLPEDYYFFVDGKAVYTYSVETEGTVLKHTDHSYTYTDNGDGTHDKACTACGEVEVDNEPHTIENHVCTACGAKEIVVSSVTVWPWLKAALNVGCMLEVTENVPTLTGMKFTDSMNGRVTGNGELVGTSDDPVHIGITVTNESSTNTGFLADNAKWSNDGSGWNSNTVTFYADNANSQGISAYYPYAENGSVAYDLTSGGYLLYRSNQRVTSQYHTVDMMDQMLARLVVTPTLSETLVSSGDRIKDIEVSGIYTEATFDGETGTLTTTGDPNSAICLAENADGTWETLLIPMDGTSVTLTIQTVNGRYFTTTTPTYGDDSFYAGTQWNVAVNVGHAGEPNYADNGDGTHSATYPCCGTIGQPEGHTLTYTANGSTITESCSANCGYSASLTLKAPANLVYDRTEKAATVEGEIIADYKLTYSADAVIMAGDYTATLTVGDYSVSLAFTIAKADPDVVTPSGLKATYGQTLADVELPGGWAWKNSSASVGSVGSNTFAAIYTPANISNFNTLERDLTVVVAKAMPTVTAPVAADDLVYNGTEQALITAGAATGGTMQYSLDGSNWSETIPTGKDAKTYTVYYKVVGDSNHNDSSVDSIQVTIGKATLTVTADSKTMTTGQGLPTFTYTITGFVGGETEDVLTAKPTVSCEADGQTAGTYGITVSGAAADNYEITHVNGTLSVVDHQHAWTYTAKDDTITATCNAEGCPDAEQSITISAVGKTYDGTPVTATLTGPIDGVATPEITYTGNTNAGTHTASITIEGETASVKFTIEKATVTVTADAKSKPYGTDNPTLTYTSEGLLGDDVLTGALETIATKTSNVGEYDIAVGSLANSNYTIDFVGAKLTITKADSSCTAPVAVSGLTFNGGNQSLITAGTATGGTMQYSLDNVTWSETIPTGKDAKTYTVYYKVVGDGNHIDTDPISLDVTITPKAVTELTFEGLNEVYAHTGETIIPTFVVKDGETTLTEGADYTEDITNNTDVGTATITITLTGNYSGTVTKTFEIKTHVHEWNYSASGDTITATCTGTIGTCSDAEQSITLNAPDAVYSGNPVEAEVTPDGADLTYTLHYTGTNYDSADAPANVGDYTVTMTVGDKSVSASFTISPKDISVVQSIQFSLAQTSFVYSGEAPALNVTGVDSSVGNYTMKEGTDYTVGTVQVNAGSHELTVTGKGNYTGSVELDYSIAAKPITITDAVVENVTFDPAGYTLTVKEVVFDGVIEGETLVMGENGDYAAVAELTSENATSDAATANVTVSLMNANYSLSETTVEATFQITQSGTEMTAMADKTSYVYGETITVTGTVKATGTAPATTLTLRSAPAAQQVALFAEDGTQLTDPMNVVDGAYTLTYNTADKGILPAEAITLTVKFVGDEDMADAAANVSIALTEKQLTATEATATTRAYEPNNTTVSVTAVTISGVIGTDDVKVDATNLTGEISSSDAGTYTSVKLADLTLTGNDSDYYTIAADDAVTTSVEVTPKEITNPTIVLDASSFVYDGTEKKPAVTSVKDGDDLIDATEYTVSYANNIEMGTATVTLTDAAGGNYTVSGSTTFQITQSGTEMTATADKTSYTYGETITVTGTVKATGTAPAATLTLRSAPAAQQVALFAADGTQLTDPVNVVEGAYTLTYNTADKGILPATSITLTVKFVGDDNMADQSAAVTVALTAKSIEPVLSGSASKAYDGITTVTDAGNLTINLNGVITGDSVSATAAGYVYADETVGQSKTVTANGITLSGADSIFYTLAQTEASAQIGEIKKAMLIGLTEPADTTLDVYCADADAVIGKLPDTVVYHLADGKTVDLKVEWSCTAYDSTPGATNTFAWAINDSEKLACYEIAQNVADDGTVIVTNSAFLTVTVTGTDTAITYNGTAYDVTQMFAIDSNAGAAVFEIIGGGTGEGTLNGSVLTITKAGTINIKVTTAPNAAYAAGEATAVLTINKGTPAVTLPTGLTAWYGQKLSDIVLPTVDGGAWSWTDMNSTVGNSGVQTHQAIFTPADTNLWNITTHPVNITVAQAGTSFGEMKVYNGNAETTTFTYGETITVKAEATAVQPAAFSLRSLIAPAKHQMALFIRNADGSEVQISEAVNEQNGVYTMTYNTTGKALSIGENALIAKFVGDENMADYQETVLVTLNPKELGIASLTAQDRVYEPGNQQVAITGTEVSGKADANDDVSVLIDGMTATISSENVGTYDTAHIPQDVSLTGNHAGYYFARGNVAVSIPQGVEITQATPYTASGAPAQPVFDPIYQDGQTLGDIPVSLPAGTFNVPGNIEWEAPGDTPVTEGTPFTWVFTPDDPNWKPVTGTVVIYPDGEPPVITAPAVDQEVTVYEGEQGTMFITAADASSYQWYINRYDGLGYVPISGATSASYATSVVNLGNDGFTYYCVASNAYGNAESPVFLLQVLEKIEVPETGDESNIALWAALAILSFAGLTIITMNGRRSKITR